MLLPVTAPRTNPILAASHSLSACACVYAQPHTRLVPINHDWKLLDFSWLSCKKQTDTMLTKHSKQTMEEEQGRFFQAYVIFCKPRMSTCTIYMSYWFSHYFVVPALSGILPYPLVPVSWVVTWVSLSAHTLSTTWGVVIWGPHFWMRLLIYILLRAG